MGMFVGKLNTSEELRLLLMFLFFFICVSAVNASVIQLFKRCSFTLCMQRKTFVSLLEFSVQGGIRVFSRNTKYCVFSI